MKMSSQVTAVGLADDLKAGNVTAESVMAATLERIDAVNPQVNAIVAVRPADDLMAEARAADLVPEADRGPLHGVPIAVKDLVNVAGVLSSHGSPIFSDHIPQTDDLIAARMRAAGAILIGKTNTPEFGLGSHSFNPVHGATLNPYDPGRSCGGSSGGAAVALATGMTVLADGSDMMGSLRNPAAWNNVYGFRPGWGVVPGEPGGDAFLHQLSTLGPMARDPRDLALLLSVMAGPDRRLPHPLEGQDFLAGMGQVSQDDIKGMRIGWLGDWGGAYEMEPGILPLCRDALKVYEDMGAEVVDVPPLFDSEILFQAWSDLRSWQVGMGLKEFADRRDMLKDSAQWELDRGRAMSAETVHDQSVMRSQWFIAAAGAFKEFDALVLPSAQVWPFPVDKPYPTEINGKSMDTYHRWMEVMVPVSLIGLPTVAMPAGFGEGGLPMGFQLFGPRGSDAKLLGMAQAYHDATQLPQRCAALV